MEGKVEYTAPKPYPTASPATGPTSYPPPGPQQYPPPSQYPPPPQEYPTRQAPYGQPPAGQVVVVSAGQQQHPVIVQQVPSYVGHIVFACLVFWCCNWLFGLIAFILAS